MPRILTKIRIDEVSAVSRGAGEGVRVLLMKRDTGGPLPARSFNDIMAKADDGDDDAGDRSDENTSLIGHPVVRLARLLVASGHKADIASALDYLLNTSHGASLLHRTSTHKAAKDHSMDTVHSIMKDAGIASVCAQIVQKGSTTISEHEIVDAVSRIAVERWPELSESQAFSRIYTASTDEARVLQKAIEIAKFSVFGVQPTMVGGVDAMNAANDDTESSEAYRQLAALGQQRWPNERSDVQFSRAFGLRPDLAVKAHRRPSPTTSFQFPR